MINFTEQHQARLNELIAKSTLSGEVYYTSMGSPLNVWDLINSTSITSLNNLKAAFTKRIEKLEYIDEWVSPDVRELEEKKEAKELVNLIIGWKRKQVELKEIESKKESLTETLNKLKEESKTPAERIAEIEKQLAEL